MKKSLLFMSVGVLIAGCTTPRPDALTKDSFDAYLDEQAVSPSAAEGKAKVAVFTSTYDKSDDQTLAALLDSKVAELITSSTGFEIAERATLEALKFEEVFSGTENGAAVPSKSDFILLAKVVSLNRQMFVDFRFYDVKMRKTVLSKNVPLHGRGRDPFEKALGEFAQAFADAYEPKVRVIQTRGDGMVARISRGLSSGVCVGMEVEFYEFEKSSIAGNGRIRDTVGRGGVIECDAGSAWVEIDDFRAPSVKVRPGDYVEIFTDPAQRRSRNIFTRTFGRIRGLFY